MTITKISISFALEHLYQVDGYVDEDGAHDYVNTKTEMVAYAFWGLAPGFGLLGTPLIVSAANSSLNCGCEDALIRGCPHRLASKMCCAKYGAANYRSDP